MIKNNLQGIELGNFECVIYTNYSKTKMLNKVCVNVKELLHLKIIKLNKVVDIVKKTG